MLAMANYADSTRTPRTLTEREQRALLKVTGEHRAGFRDHCLYAMALGTGLREHELIALSVGDVFRDGRPKRRLLLSVFKGAGKAGGTQEVLLSESLRGKLRRFHQWTDENEEIRPRLTGPVHRLIERRPGFGSGRGRLGRARGGGPG